MTEDQGKTDLLSESVSRLISGFDGLVWNEFKQIELPISSFDKLEVETLKERFKRKLSHEP